MNRSLLAPEAYLEQCKSGILPLLDVRAPAEFLDGHIEKSFNAPILDDEERRQVGTTYKKEGGEAATRLGYQLVNPFKAERVANWADFLKRQEVPVLTCWRGGDRSRIAQEWLKEAGVSAWRIQGGYKALRAALTNQFEIPFTGFSLSGLTGSGKTTFLRSLKSPSAIDLEGYANHRGSAFGGYYDPQPRQATFENSLGLALVRAGFPKFPLLIESESRLIGKTVLPKAFFEVMRSLPRIILEVPEAERVKNLFRDYVEEPLEKVSREKHRDTLLRSTAAIKDKLGGLAYSEIAKGIADAFCDETPDFAKHAVWIEALLKDYYDPRYRYSREKSGGEIVFRGSPEEIKHWLKAQRTT